MSLRNLKVFGLIPARGGSRGIKNKNMLLVNDRPLIDYTIDAALNSKYIDEVYLSSDSSMILDHSRKRNISIVDRPKEYAKDDSSAVDVVSHFYDFLKNKNIISNKEDFFLCYLQPTSPLRTTTILDASFLDLEQGTEDSLISLVENEHTPFKSFVLDEDGLAKSLFEESLSNQNRQELEKTYRVNGAIYTFLISKFIENKGFPSNFSRPFLMDPSDSLDIDSYDDLDILKSKLSLKKEK